jgi:hypothetical protein
MARPKFGEEKHATERVGFRLPKWVRAGLDRIAKERKAALTDVVGEALVAYLGRHGVKAPEEAAKAESRRGKAGR